LRSGNDKRVSGTLDRDRLVKAIMVELAP
jgi:hypothetical protein